MKVLAVAWESPWAQELGALAQALAREPDARMEQALVLGLDERMEQALAAREPDARMAEALASEARLARDQALVVARLRQVLVDFSYFIVLVAGCSREHL